MTLPLFRREALEHQRTRLWGEVILMQPLGYRIITVLLLVMVLAAGVFLTGQSYARKETVSGYLVPEGGLSQIMSQRGGIVEAIYASPGDRLDKGAPIARIRLENMLPSGVSAQAELLDSVERELDDVTRRMETLPDRQKREKAALEEKRQSQSAALTALWEEKGLLEERLSLARTTLETAEDLAEKGHMPARLARERRETMLSLRQSLVSLERETLSAQAALKQTDSDLGLIGYRFDDEQARLAERLEGLRQRKSTLAQNSGYVLTSAVDGTVSGVFISVGAVIKPGVPAAAVRPAGSRLQARLLVPSRAAGLIATGQKARIQYDAFPYQRFGVFTGEVTEISASILTPAELQTPVAMQESFYLAGVALDSQTVTAGGQPVALKAGMILKADITLEKRSLLEWLLDPILALKGRT